MFVLGHHRPSHPCELIGERNGSDLGRSPRQKCREPRSVSRAVDLGVADDGESSGREKTTQIAVASFADVAQPVLAAARVLLGDQSDPGREVTP